MKLSEEQLRARRNARSRSYYYRNRELLLEKKKERLSKISDEKRLEMNAYRLKYYHEHKKSNKDNKDNEDKEENHSD